jgi:mediator of RNA polymerase II transcription subunit 17
LDAISILLSRDEKGLAATTISPGLKEIVPLKTFGASKMATSQTTEAQRLENKQIARGWKAQSLDKTVDSILASATRLEKEIEHETKYWEQVLAVSDKGWAVCRLPDQKHILGVRFGFAEGKSVNMKQLTMSTY